MNKVFPRIWSLRNRGSCPTVYKFALVAVCPISCAQRCASLPPPRLAQPRPSPASAPPQLRHRSASGPPGLAVYDAPICPEQACASCCLGARVLSHVQWNIDDLKVLLRIHSGHNGFVICDGEKINIFKDVCTNSILDLKQPVASSCSPILGDLCVSTFCTRVMLF